MPEITQSNKLLNVRYDVRGPILTEAKKLEAAGEEILRLNIGNPAPFGFHAPDTVLAAMQKHLTAAEGYSDSQGILVAREAVSNYYAAAGIEISPNHIWLGNGVSELISMSLQALLDSGDEVLIPAPDYPLWTGAVTLAGGTAVHYLCDESAGWIPDLADIEAKITPNSKAIVLINPNNPTGAVYSAATVAKFVDLARQHNLVLFADEIYEKILFDGAVHTHAAKFADPEVLIATFSGLSKAYQIAGFRSGWLSLTGAISKAQNFIEGLTLLANMRMCANVPAQYAIETALNGPQEITDLVKPGGRLLAQRDVAFDLITQIPGISCVKPQGALYLFPKLDPAIYPIKDDQQFVIDILKATHILITHGTGFNWPHPDHLRLVTLPAVPVLTDAIGRLSDYLASVRG